MRIAGRIALNFCKNISQGCQCLRLIVGNKVKCKILVVKSSLTLMNIEWLQLSFAISDLMK